MKPEIALHGSLWRLPSTHDNAQNHDDFSRPALGAEHLAGNLPPKLVQFRIRNNRLWLALRLRGARSKKSIQQFAEEMLTPVLERELAPELDELPFVPDVDD